MSNVSKPKTSFVCKRCGYKCETFTIFKRHLERKNECEPKESNMSLEEVRNQYMQTSMHANLPHPKEEKGEVVPEGKNERMHTPEKRRKKKIRNFGDENRDYLKKEYLKQFVENPLKGIQEIIECTHFNIHHEENHNVRLTNDEKVIQVFKDNSWLKFNKDYVLDKMIYTACSILEYNIPRKYWTGPFTEFISSMGNVDNDDLIETIREEVEDTVAGCHKKIFESKEPS
jgi:hypothetical protein